MSQPSGCLLVVVLGRLTHFATKLLGSPRAATSGASLPGVRSLGPPRDWPYERFLCSAAAPLSSRAAAVAQVVWVSRLPDQQGRRQAPAVEGRGRPVC